QSHLLNFYPELAPPQQEALLAQIDSMDLESLPALIQQYVLNKPALHLPSDIKPVKAYPLDHASHSRPWDRAAMKRAGEALIKAGKVAACVGAGGQGSRLGFDGPKGCYPAGAVTNKPLFQIFAEGILATGRKYDTAIAWYVMTSPLNHGATVAFFEQ